MLGNGHSPEAQPFFLCPLTCLFGHAQAFDPDDGYMPGLRSTVHDQIGVNMTTTEAPLHNKDSAAVGRKSFSKEVSYYADFSTGAQDTTCEVCQHTLEQHGGGDGRSEGAASEARGGCEGGEQ